MIIKGPDDVYIPGTRVTQWIVSGGRWNGTVLCIDGIYSCNCLQYEKYGKDSHRCTHIDQVKMPLTKTVI